MVKLFRDDGDQFNLSIQLGMMFSEQQKWDSYLYFNGKEKIYQQRFITHLIHSVAICMIHLIV